MSTKNEVAAYGRPPRADLLPPEIRAAKRGDRTRRALLFGVVIVAVLVSGGYGFAFFETVQTQSALSAEQERTIALLKQQTEYLPGRQVKQKIGSLESALQVGASTEINWQQYLALVEQSLPAGTTITVFAVDSISPLDETVTPTNPLQGQFVATITFTASSETLPDIEVWLRGLETLPGFADANPDNVSKSGSDPYVASITMHVTGKAYSGRFQPEVVDEDAADDETTTETDTP